MNLSVGIVGLPNVGKSTLFNALLKKQQALAANYPFATIEPNVGIVPVPDSRLKKLAEVERDSIAALQNDNRLPPIKPATVEFVDIAGLVKGASEGAGLGNKFLSHIREVSVIAHVVRAFEDGDVIREGSVSPEEDYTTIQTELMLADMQSAQNQGGRLKTNDPLKPLLERIVEDLNKDIPVRNMQFSDEEREKVKQLFFITNKPEIIVLNTSEDEYTEENIPKIVARYKELLSKKIAASPSTPRNDNEDNMVVICAKVESDLASLSDEEQVEYLKDLGIETSGLERLIQKAYQELGLISFLTAGEKEVRAWTMRKGGNAVEASGEIHTDFMKKFIKAEVVGFNDYVELGGRKKAREVGKAGLEGKEYIVKDGDVIEFKIGS